MTYHSIYSMRERNDGDIEKSVGRQWRVRYLSLRYYNASLEAGCWLWRGYRNKHGYGRYGSQGFLAHRVVYEIFRGPIPDNMLVCHRCDIPACVRPSHLFVGTHEDNNHDMIDKQRHCHGENQWTKLADLKGEKAHCVILTELEVKQIRERAENNYRGLQSQLAREYGVTAQTICDILKRRSWTHV